MRYRTKLLIAFLTTAVLVNGLSFAYFYRKMRQQIVFQLQHRVLAIAVSIAPLIDGDLLASIRTREDETGPAYIKIRDTQRRVRDANRQASTDVGFIYTFSASPDRPDLLHFIVDAGDSVENRSHVGDLYHYKGGLITVKHTQIRNTRSIKGTWLSAYAPVRSDDGKLVGTLGVDLRQTM